ncbi:related to Antagonist of mitotic exit network protein 1 [Zygosaccharomyces bailii]|nr:related to Antagonist of mitotic exit network protein 1 [Zygosaccharomyces bailii]
MKFAALGNGSFKRLRETQVEFRPRKKSSPIPSDSESETESFNKRYPLEGVLRRRCQERKRRWRTSGSDVKTDKAEESDVQKTPERNWENARIDSVVQLAPVSPTMFNEERVTKHLADLKLVTPTQSTPPRISTHAAPHAIFEMPEIVERILQFVSLSEEVPRERPYARRRPLSYEHALMIYKDEKKAAQVWNARSHNGSRHSTSGNMYCCMLVNRLWHHIALDLLLKRLHFKDLHKFHHFVQRSRTLSQTRNKVLKPTMLVLHKFHKLRQEQMDELSVWLSCENLKWLEFYICPSVVPPMSWIRKFSHLEKLVLPGNKRIDDQFLLQVSTYVRSLKVLDLRACDNVTDTGVIAMALKCPQLQACNLGRHRNGGNITSLAVVALARHTQIETLGTAGCKVTDAGLWELAQLRGRAIRRLSLNNCDLLTNHSIPTLFAFNYFPNLAVLELRHVDQITDVKNLVQFKLWKKAQNLPILIEGCERLTMLISEEESRIRRNNSLLAMQDMSSWVNENEL